MEDMMITVLIIIQQWKAIDSLILKLTATE